MPGIGRPVEDRLCVVEVIGVVEGLAACRIVVGDGRHHPEVVGSGDLAAVAADQVLDIDADIRSVLKFRAVDGAGLHIVGLIDFVDGGVTDALAGTRCLAFAGEDVAGVVFQSGRVSVVFEGEIEGGFGDVSRFTPHCDE